MAVDFGSCWSCVSSVTSPSSIASGFRVIGEAIARRWQTPRGGLVDDPNYGYDLTDYISDDLTSVDLTRIGQQAASEAAKDERVLSCQVKLSMVGGVMMVAAAVKTTLGPFQLVLAVSNVTVTLLQVTP